MFSISKNIDYILKMISDLLGLIKMHLFKFISLLFHIFFIIILKKLQKYYFSDFEIYYRNQHFE